MAAVVDVQQGRGQLEAGADPLRDAALVEVLTLRRVADDHALVGIELGGHRASANVPTAATGRRQA